MFDFPPSVLRRNIRLGRRSAAWLLDVMYLLAADASNATGANNWKIVARVSEKNKDRSYVARGYAQTKTKKIIANAYKTEQKQKQTLKRKEKK